MDPLTHVIAGVVAGGLLEADAAGFATAAVAAMAPDAEFVTRRIPRTAFLDYHHGVVHTIPGGLLAGFVIAMGAGAIFGRGWESMLPFALAGVGSHIALDLLMHNNGIALFAPFSRRRYSFPVVLGLNHLTSSRTCRDRKYGTCIACQTRGLRYNPFFWVLMIAALACLAVPALSRAWAILALSVLVGLSFNANSYRSVALGVAGNAPHALRVKAFPASHSMSRWLVLREEPEETHATLVEARGPRVLWARSVPKQIPPPPVLESERLLSVRGFKNSVIFPHWVHERVDGIEHVTWSDLSYLFSEQTELYALHVRLAADGSVLQNEFHERW